MDSRAPQGARGLKSRPPVYFARRSRSRPARGAWIEIPSSVFADDGGASSRPARGAWIEISIGQLLVFGQIGSRPARGAWIEIFIKDDSTWDNTVAPRKGRVD